MRRARAVLPAAAILCMGGLIFLGQWDFAWLIALGTAAIVPLMRSLEMTAGEERVGVLPAVLVLIAPSVRWISLPVSRTYATGQTLLPILAVGVLLAYARTASAPVWGRFRGHARPLGRPLLLLAAAVLLSQIASGDILRPVDLITSPFSVAFVLGGLAFYALGCLAGDTALLRERVLEAGMVMGLLQAAVVLDQATGGIVGIGAALGAPAAVSGYVAGLLGDGELTSELLVIMLIWSLSLAVWGGTGRRRLLGTACSLVYLIGCLAMSHRSAFLGAIGALAAIALLGMAGRADRAKGKAAVAVLAVLLVFGLFWVSFSQVQALPDSVLGRMATQGIGQTDMLNRGVVYATAISLAPQVPVTGFGIGVVDQLNAAGQTQYISTHSLWLWAGLSAGIVGLAACVWLFGGAFTISLREWRHSPSAATAALFATSVFLIIDQSKIDYVRIPVYAYFLMGVLGLVSSLGGGVNDPSDHGGLAALAADGVAKP